MRRFDHSKAILEQQHQLACDADAAMRPRPQVDSPSSSWRRQGLEANQERHRPCRRVAAHLRRGAQARAYGGPIGRAEQRTGDLRGQVRAAFAGGLAVRQRGQRRRDRRGDAARTAAGSTYVRGRSQQMKRAERNCATSQKPAERTAYARCRGQVLVGRASALVDGTAARGHLWSMRHLHAR